MRLKSNVKNEIAREMLFEGLISIFYCKPCRGSFVIRQTVEWNYLGDSEKCIDRIIGYTL